MEGDFTLPIRSQNKIKIFEISRCKPSLSWLKSNILKIKQEKDSFPCKNSSNSKFYKLLEYSIPPIFHPKFYNLSLENYTKEFNNDSGVKYLSIATGLMFINQEFGYQLLDHIKKDEFIEEHGEICCGKVAIDNFIHVLCSSFHGGEKISPVKNDLCATSSEFLLEPSVLIQLPWKPVMFHQWLTIALSEVLMFDKDSMELRHWSMSKDIVSVATNLLSLVANLKEKIMLGFAILNEATDNYSNTLEKFERKYMESILDNVIVPSLPVLEFLASGSAKSCIQNIKNNSTSDKLYYVPEQAYKINETLDNFSLNFAYNFHIWSSREVARIFPLATEKVGAIAPKLMNKNKIDISSTEQFKPMCLSEARLLHLARDNFYKLSANNVLKLTIKVIQDNVIKTDKILGITLQDVENKFNSGHVKHGPIFDDTKSEAVHLAIRQALIYYEVRKLLNGWDKNASVANQLMSLQLESLEQEQIARLSNACAAMFNTHTVMQASDSKSFLSVQNLTEEIQKIQDQVMKSKRKSFWLKCNKNWRQKVNPDEEFLELKSVQNLDQCIQHMLNRIGRIVYNHSYDFFNTSYKFENNFEEINFIHYVLPYIVYFFANKYKNDTTNIMYYSFIQEWIRIYEKNYVQHLKNETKKCKSSKETIKVAPLPVSNKKSIDLLSVSAALKICIEIPLNCAAEQKISFKFLEQLLDFFIHIKDWYPSIMRDDEYLFCASCLQNLFVGIFHNSIQYYYSILIHIHKSLLTSFKVPEIRHSLDLFPRIPQLNDLYFAASVLSDITCVYSNANLKDFEMPQLQKNEYDFETMKYCLNEAKYCLNEATIAIAKQVLIKSRNSPLHGRGDYIDFNFVREKVSILHNIYAYFVFYNRQLGIPNFMVLPVLPYSLTNPEVKSVVKLFLNGKYAEFKDKIKIFTNLAAIHYPEEHTICRRCGKVEDPEIESFTACIQCVEQNYPQTNYFCSKFCEKEIWRAEHMAEHLEFELGLGQFYALNILEKN